MKELEKLVESNREKIHGHGPGTVGGDNYRTISSDDDQSDDGI